MVNDAIEYLSVVGRRQRRSKRKDSHADNEIISGIATLMAPLINAPGRATSNLQMFHQSMQREGGEEMDHLFGLQSIGATLPT
jgi:hypothetical protein